MVTQTEKDYGRLPYSSSTQCGSRHTMWQEAATLCSSLPAVRRAVEAQTMVRVKRREVNDDKQARERRERDARMLLTRQ